jgi:hypothetical protein
VSASQHDTLLRQAWALAKRGLDADMIFEVLRKHADSMPLLRPDKPWLDSQLREFAESAVRKQTQQ